MKTHLLPILIAIALTPVSFGQKPAELTPLYPREERVNVATPPTSGSLAQRPGGRPQAQPRPMLDSVARWREFDEKLTEASRRFAENSTRRKELLKSLAQIKDRASSEIDPASIIARKELERLYGELHTVIEADKTNDDQAVRLLRQALSNRERWAGTLDGILNRSLAGKGVAAAERDRMRRWREGIARLQQNDSRDFIKQIAGNDYGDYLVNSNPTLARLRDAEGGNPPLRGGLEGEGRGFWFNRIAQLERTQASLRQQLDYQDQEIARLRKMLENRDRDDAQRNRPGDRRDRDDRSQQKNEQKS